MPDVSVFSKIVILSWTIEIILHTSDYFCKKCKKKDKPPRSRLEKSRLLDGKERAAILAANSKFGQSFTWVPWLSFSRYSFLFLHSRHGSIIFRFGCKRLCLVRQVTRLFLLGFFFSFHKPERHIDREENGYQIQPLQCETLINSVN